MAVSSLAAALDQLAAIKAEVEQYGSATITCDKLEALCPDAMSVTDQFLRIGEIARTEGWDVDFARYAVVRFVSPVKGPRVAV